jgi:hypothetical protein
MHRQRSEPFWNCARGSSFLVLLAVVWGVPGIADPAAAQEERTGIELAGRSDKDEPPEDWYVYDAKDKGADRKRIARVHKMWGFTKLPAGDYAVGVVPPGSSALEVTWGEVSVAEGKVTTVKIDSGIELSGRSDKDDPLRDWFAYDAKGGKENRKPAARVYSRWGFTPLPPGEYEVTVLPRGNSTIELPWTKVAVAAGKTAAVNIASGIDLT